MEASDDRRSSDARIAKNLTDVHRRKRHLGDGVV
jgi:hypothetical protein